MVVRSGGTKLFREILWRPGVAVVLALYGLLQLISNLITWTLPVKDQEKYQFIQLLNWRVWMIGTPILTVVLIVLIVRAIYKVIEKRDIDHVAEISKLTADHKTELSTLESNIKIQHKSEIETLESHINSIYEEYRKRMLAHREHYNTKVSELLSRVSEQSKRINELSRPRLIFEVERCPRCRVTLSHEKYTFAPPDGEPKEVDYYAVNAHIKIHFENDDEIKLRLRKRIGVSLLRRTARGKEKEIPLDPERESLLILAGEGSQVIPKLENFIFEPLSKTDSYMLYCGMGISTRYGKRLNRNCFIRLTMEAIRQPPCYVDLDVNWDDAKTEGGSAMTPRMSAQCRVHR